MAKNSLVVYTCITGGYDTLREIRYKSPDIDYVCFTDNAKLTSKTWKVLPLPNEVLSSEKSSVKKQRLVKLLPHKWFPDYTASLWIDSNIEIIGDLSDFFSKYSFEEKFLYVNKHPSRDCIYREQLAIIRLNKDTFENTSPQINRYRDEGFPEHYGLAETNILLRKHDDKSCIKLMELWAKEVREGSHRDQLSFNYCVWKCDCKDKIKYLDEKYYNLHVSDNAFFCLRRHVNIGKIDAFPNQTKTIDTKELAKKEEAKVTSNEVAKSEATATNVVPEKKDPARKPVSVVVFTHDRTNVARETLKSLFKNVKYSGELNWVLADDRSTKQHLAEMKNVFIEAGVKYELCQTTKTRFGLGASMNIGLQKAFKKSDIVLRVEDDWILEKELQLDRFVKTLEENDNVAGIRLGMVGGGVNIGQNIFKDALYKVLVGPNDSSWLFVNQVALVHKRIHNALGWYLENVGADRSEEEFRTRFNRATENGRKRWLLLVPNEMKWRTFDDPSLWFIHVGRSTLGHTIYREPKRYGWIYTGKKPIQKASSSNKGQFDVVYVLGGASPHGNEELRYSLRSIEKFVKGVRNIFVVGKNPGFLSDKVIFIPTNDIAAGDLQNKDRNHWHNMEIVCNDPRLSENFLFAADDFLVIKDSEWKDFAPRHTGLASRQYMNAPNYSNWTAVRKATLKRFPENRRYLWHPHMISQMNKTKVLQCCKDSDYKNRSDVVIFSYYFNHEPMPKPLFDFDTQELHTAKKMDLSVRHVSHWEEAFSYKPFKDQLKKLFPTKSKYEAYDIAEEKINPIMASVILPCYNCEKYVSETLDSIIGHNSTSYEIICIDDKSTDGSLKILENYANKHDNIRIIRHETNKGLSVSRNDALKIAKGKYVVLIDSDDKFVDKAIDTIVASMEKDQLDIFYLRMKSFFDSAALEAKYSRYKDYYKRPQLPKVMDGRSALKYFYSKRYNGFGSCENAFRREFLIDIGVKYMESIFYEDNPYNVYALLNAKRVFNTSKDLYMRRIRANSIVTEKKNFKHFRSYMLVCKDIVKTVLKIPLENDLFSKVFSYLIQAHFSNAEHVWNAAEKDKDVFIDKKNFADSEKIIDMFKTIRKDKTNFKTYAKVFYGKIL